MRRVSKKRQALVDVWRPIRDGYLAEMQECVVTGDRSIEVHEMVGGPCREAAYQEPACWLPVSRGGHEVAQYMPKSLQLAYKLRYDPTRFDLDKFNAIYAPKGTGVTLAEVVAHLEVIQY